MPLVDINSAVNLGRLHDVSLEVEGNENEELATYTQIGDIANYQHFRHIPVLPPGVAFEGCKNKQYVTIHLIYMFQLEREKNQIYVGDPVDEEAVF